MQGEFQFLNINVIDEIDIYKYVHKSFFSNKGCKILIDYIKTNFDNCTKENSITLLNRFAEILNKSKIDITKELYEDIKNKTNLLDKCIKLIIDDKKYIDMLNDYSLDLIEYYYNDKDEYIDTINDLTENDEIILHDINIFSSTIKELQNIPLLSDEQTYEYTTKYNETHEKKYRDLIIVHNLRLIYPIANKYSNNSNLEFEDLLFEGVFGLIRALEDYDPRKAKFSTYATYWIEQKIRRYIYDRGSNIRIPVFKHEKLNKYKKAKNELYEKLGRNPTDKEVAEKLKIDVSKIDEYKKLLLPLKSLNEATNNENEDEIIDYIPSEEKTPEQKAIDNNYYELNEAIKELNDDQKIVLYLRYGLYDGKTRTLTEVKDDLLRIKNKKITSERVRQIEEKALSILKEKLKKQNEYTNKALEEKLYTEEYLDIKLLLLLNILKSTNDKLLNEILEQIPKGYTEILSKYFDNNYNPRKDKIISYNTKLLLVKDLLPKITNARDRIISYSFNNTNGIVLPTNIYVYFNHINDYLKTKEHVNKCIDRMDPSDRYILGKYYDIRYDNGGLITTRITNKDKIKLSKILKNIEFDLPVSKSKVYNKKTKKDI